MRKTKFEKGITLIALIITIIILLILAIVTIGALNNSNIIAYAQNAVKDYNKSKSDEDKLLGEYESDLKKYSLKGNIVWTDNGDGTFTSSNDVTVEIGDYVDYNEGTGYTHTPDLVKGVGTSWTGGSSTEGITLATTELSTEDLEWRVLGINNKGQLELISADPTEQTLYLANDEGYLNIEDNLNNLCNDLYGQGTYAESARSLNLEDIDNLTNYDPTTFDGYGKEWRYRYPTQEEMDEDTGTENSKRYMQWSGSKGANWINITDLSYQTFRLPGEQTAISSTNPGSKTVTYTYYTYYISNNMTTDDGYISEEKIEEISNMITKGTTSSYITQWLASSRVVCSVKGAFFRVYRVTQLGGGAVAMGDNLFDSNERFYYKNAWVRPVVTLTSNVSVIRNENTNSVDNMWTLTK